MSSSVKRYTQPCVQTQPGEVFKVAEVELFEDPKGKWVRYEDYRRLRMELERAQAAYWTATKP